MSSQIRTYSELRQQIHHDLRVQHPEWIQPNGESPMCDSYDARLLELLDTLGDKKLTSLSLLLVAASDRESESKDSTAAVRSGRT